MMTTAAAAVWASSSAAEAAVHVVTPGETLSGIAARYGTTVAALADANDITNPDMIVAGRRLRVPGRVAVTSVHVVRRGETLSGIAARYGTTVARLARLNRIADPNLIVAGAELRIPARGQAAPAAAPAGSIESILERHAASHSVGSPLVKAVAWQESGWRQDVVSVAGAVGVMQVMPGTADYVNRSLGGGNLRLRGADDNVHLGVMYLRHLLGAMPSERKALAAYYSGPANVGRRLHDYQRHYVANVVALKSRFR